MKRRRGMGCLYIIMFFMFIVCFTMKPITVKAAKLSLNKTYISMVRGETKVLKVKGATKTVKWTYNKKLIAIKELNKNSILIAGKKDRVVTKVKARSGKNEVVCTVAITPASDNNIELVRKDGKITLRATKDLGVLKKAITKDTSTIKVVSLKGRRIKVKGLKPGRAVLNIQTEEGTYIKVLQVVDFGRTGTVKSTQVQYRAWRKKWIRDNISPDCSDLDAIRLVALWVSQRKYGNHYNGYDLWRYGDGTCVAGANMVKDFCDDLGIYCKVRFAGNDNPPAGIIYGSQHYNCLVKIGKKKYHVNATPTSGAAGGAIIFQV